MITQERVMEILKEAGVLLEGHFLLTSGKHSNKYLQCAKIFRNTKYSEELCKALAEHFQDQGVEVVIGPALGAVQMTYEVSRWLRCENFFAERDNGVMTLRRGFGVGAIVDRTAGKVDFGVPFQSVIAVEVDSWEPDECPLCREGAPAPIKPGSRKVG